MQMSLLCTSSDRQSSAETKGKRLQHHSSGLRDALPRRKSAFFGLNMGSLSLFTIAIVALSFPFIFSTSSSQVEEGGIVEEGSGLPSDLVETGRSIEGHGLTGFIHRHRDNDEEREEEEKFSASGAEDEAEKKVGAKKGRKRKASFPPPAVRRSIIDTDESEECLVPRPIEECQLPPKEKIHVVFVSAMWYREEMTQRETETMLKSLLFGTRCRVHIHFMVAGEPEVSTLHKMMRRLRAAELVPRPSPYTVSGQPPPPNLKGLSGYMNLNATTGKEDVIYSLHTIPTEWVIEKAKALHLFPLAHHAGVPGMSKVFMPEILWQVRRAVYLDVDMILGGDVQDLWRYFRQMDRDRRLLFLMGNNHPEGHNRRRLLRPLCSCQLVLDLDRLRRANFTQLFISTLNGHKPKDLKEYVEDGDQFLFMRTCKLVKGVCRALPRMWNVSGCSKPVPFLGLGSKGKERNGTCWRVVHFNCMGHRNKGSGRYNIPPQWKEVFAWTRSLRLEGVRSPRRFVPVASS